MALSFKTRLLLLCLGVVSSIIPYVSNAQRLQTIEDLGLWVVYVNTIDSEEPTCDVLYPPAGCGGLGITNVNTVSCRVSIVSGPICLYDSGNLINKNFGATIRVRGNTSAAQYEKKPYKIKLDRSADLLNRDNPRYFDRDWLLLKNWGINGMIGFKLNEILGMSYCPNFRYVNLVINGTYRGVYILCESVKRNKGCRINISGTGFIAEYDTYWWNEDIYVYSKLSKLQNYTFKYPDGITSDFLDYFSLYIDRVESAIKKEDFDKFIDVNSFVLWCIGHDILGTFDDCGSNLFLTKYDNTENSLLTMPCLWDFDGIMGSSSQLPNVFANVHSSFYYYYLFSKPKFVSQYVSTYEQISESVFSALSDSIKAFVASDYGNAYERSFNEDYLIWDFYKTMDVEQSYAAWILKSLDWLEKRRFVLDKAVRHLKIGTSLLSKHVCDKESYEMYDLFGRRIASPGKSVFIRNGEKYIAH